MNVNFRIAVRFAKLTQSFLLRGCLAIFMAASVCAAEGLEPSAQTLAETRTQARDGNAEAQYELALAYACGRGMTRDRRQAAKWFEMAAMQGHSKAQSALGWMRFVGKGVKQDNKQAVSWLTKAAEQGDAAAQNNLGIAYATGRGVVRDADEARKWFGKAAESGAEEALFNLDRLDGRGERSPQVSVQKPDTSATVSSSPYGIDRRCRELP